MYNFHHIISAEVVTAHSPGLCVCLSVGQTAVTAPRELLGHLIGWSRAGGWLFLCGGGGAARIHRRPLQLGHANWHRLGTLSDVWTERG